MELLFLALGLVDFIAGVILFFEPSALTKLIAVILLTKGTLTIFKSIQH